MNENAVRHWPSRRSSRVYGATETNRVNASGWSPTFPSMIVSPLIRAARSLAIATTVGIREPGHDGGCVTGRGRGDRDGVGERRQQPAALVERDRVRVDLADLGERDHGGADEAVVHGQDRLRDDRERRLVEQVVRLGDRADERALDREDAVGDAAGGDGLDDVGERRQRHEARRREEPVAGRGGMGALASGVGDGQFVGSHGGKSAFRWMSVRRGLS